MELLSTLDRRGMNKLRASFKKASQGLNLTSFVKLLSVRLPESSIDDKELIWKLQDLFEQIDVNGDGRLDWKEFSEFCINAGMAATSNSSLEITEKYVARRFIDVVSHTTHFNCLKYIDEFDLLAVCENMQPIVKIYHAFSMKMAHQIQIGSSALCTEFISTSTRKLLAVSSSNLTISLWDISGIETTSPRHLQNFQTETAQRILTFAPHLQALFTTGAGSKIHMYRLEAERLQLVSAFKSSHSDLIKDMLAVPELDLLITCGLDKRIILWKMEGSSMKVKCELLGHFLGVRSLAYAFTQSHTLLISAGFDMDCLVWDLARVGTVPLMKLTSNAPLVAVAVLPSNMQAITIDVDGLLKTWDLREEDGLRDNERGIQSFTIGAAEPVCMAVSSSGSIFTGKNRISIFDAVDLESQKHHPVACIFNPTSLTIVCAIQNDIKIWDAVSGELKSHFQNISGAVEITQINLDFRNRKLCVMDQRGGINVVNYLNGVQMKSHSATNKEISRSVYVKEDQVLLVASWDRTICIYDETVSDKVPLLRKVVDAHSADINALAYSHALSLIASGSESGIVRLWDYQFLTYETDLQVGSPVTAILFFENFPILMTFDQSGLAKLWVIRPFESRLDLFRNACFASFSCKLLFGFNTNEEFVTCAELLPNFQVAVASNTGRVTVVDMSPSFQDFEPISESVNKRENFNPYRKLTCFMDQDKIAAVKSEMTVDDLPWPLLLASWKQHESSIISLQIIPADNGIQEQLALTCAEDKAVRLYRIGGMILGELDSNERKALQLLQTKKKWSFPIDMKCHKQMQLDQATILMGKLVFSGNDAPDNVVDILKKNEEMELAMKNKEQKEIAIRKANRLQRAQHARLLNSAEACASDKKTVDDDKLVERSRLLLQMQGKKNWKKSQQEVAEEKVRRKKKKKYLPQVTSRSRTPLIYEHFERETKPKLTVPISSNKPSALLQKELDSISFRHRAFKRHEMSAPWMQHEEIKNPFENLAWDYLKNKIKSELQKKPLNVFQKIRASEEDAHYNEEIDMFVTKSNTHANKAELADQLAELRGRLSKRIPSKVLPSSSQMELLKSSECTTIKRVSKTLNEPNEAQIHKLKTQRFFGIYSKPDVMYFKQLFHQLDSDHDGVITLKEWQAVMRETSTESGNFRSVLDDPNMFNILDKDNSGAIAMGEFARIIFNKASVHDFDDIMAFLSLPSKKEKTSGLKKDSSGNNKVKHPRSFKTEIRALFNLYDLNRDGEINMNELQHALQQNSQLYLSTDHKTLDRGLNFGDLDELCKKFDLDKNSTINFDEFYMIFIENWS